MKSIELFAGAGGLGMGLEQAGFYPEQVIEWDKYCCDTIRFNKSNLFIPVNNWPLFEGDIRNINFNSFEGSIDLVSGGPPCQPFSLGGKHGANDDFRDMFPEAIRAVRQTKPKAFIFENVKGLTRRTFRTYFEYICLQLEHPTVIQKKHEEWHGHLKRLLQHHASGLRRDLHYNVVTRVLNAANFGVPQKRERIFFVGFRDDLQIKWNFPDETHSIDALAWSLLNDNKYWDHHKIPISSRKISPKMRSIGEKLKSKPDLIPWKTIRDVTMDLPKPTRIFQPDSKFPCHRFQPGAKAYPGHTGSQLDEPAKTLKAGVHGVPGGENMLALTTGEVRYFTIQESKRIQTFPDNYVFHGSWSEIMRQLGNAVPVYLAKLLGKDIAKHLKKSIKKNEPSG